VISSVSVSICSGVPAHLSVVAMVTKDLSFLKPQIIRIPVFEVVIHRIPSGGVDIWAGDPLRRFTVSLKLPFPESPASRQAASQTA
jgi:hypothetical protein